METAITLKPEPIQYSNQNILIENLKKFGRKNYLHRFIYVFEYTKPNPEFAIYEVIGDLIKKVNENYCDELLTGVLLFYQRYGVNMIEGSEDSIFKHIQELLNSNITQQNVGRIKILLAVSHIKHRFFSHWTYFTGQPHTLLERIDINSSVEETSKQIKAVVTKLYAMWQYLRSHTMAMERLMNIEKLTDFMTTNLPEFARLEFVLATSALQDLKEFIISQRKIIHQPVLYQEMIWPQQTEYIPYGTLKKKSLDFSYEGELDITNNN